ncbi:MAG: IclR family transcriptional regulator [Lachnospiraceae bacterium]|nr:IclR family transcriptional regulator [Lachnospiraceae bacterium]MBD5455594.1 IclR family transcriptional regulator [Lachnospiraceae bacterium]MBD5475734.1 IclR family transcriptional regulator [Lachnospiraceae bacterium]
MSEENNIVPAVNRSIDILEYIAQAPNPVTIKELSDALDIPTASCFRIVKNLLARKYLIEDRYTKGRYLYGFRAIELAEYALYKLDLRTIAIPFMKTIAMELNQAVQLSVLETGGVIFIEQTLPINPINAMAKQFVPSPVNVSAGGKILCAYMPLYKKNDYLSHAELAQYTEYSITDHDALMKELEKVAERGYALDMQEFSIGVGCIAVPIFNYTGNCIAAIGITGSYQEYQDQKNIDRFFEIMKHAADEISLQMGYNY